MLINLSYICTHASFSIIIYACNSLYMLHNFINSSVRWLHYTFIRKNHVVQKQNSFEAIAHRST